MPAGDRTGPRGMGPKTGRAAGYCAGNDRPGFETAPGGGRGMGRRGRMGGGRGMAYRHGWRGGRDIGAIEPARESLDVDERETLLAKIDALQEDIIMLKQRLASPPPATTPDEPAE